MFNQILFSFELPSKEKYSYVINRYQRRNMGFYKYVDDVLLSSAGPIKKEEYANAVTEKLVYLLELKEAFENLNNIKKWV